MKTATVWIDHEDTAFALFFRPHRGAFDISNVPTTGNFPSKEKRDANGAFGFD